MNCSYILLKQPDFFTEKNTEQTERRNKISILNNYLKYITKEAIGFRYKKRQSGINHPRKTKFGFMERNVFEEESRKSEKMSLTEKLSTPMKLGILQAVELKKWVGLKVLENPRRSIVDYGTVGCTTDLMGRGKRLIIVDCITENGPILGALWTFSTESKTKRGNHMIFNSLKLL